MSSTKRTIRERRAHFDASANGSFINASQCRLLALLPSSLHNYSTRSDSLDLRVVDVPKLLRTTYQLKEQVEKLNEQQQQQQKDQLPLCPSNGDLSSVPKRKQQHDEHETIRTRIVELEDELNRLRSQLPMDAQA